MVHYWSCCCFRVRLKSAQDPAPCLVPAGSTCTLASRLGRMISSLPSAMRKVAPAFLPVLAAQIAPPPPLHFLLLRSATLLTASFLSTYFLIYKSSLIFVEILN
uniref:Uncharacterized protein n=1 Tax=Opuntia streptacantha TaxID=393608 RepID=A0A7C9A1P4_OPUST